MHHPFQCGGAILTVLKKLEVAFPLHSRLRSEAHIMEEGGGYMPMPFKGDVISSQCPRRWKGHPNYMQESIVVPQLN
jgi:hypothetical protein